MDLAKLKERLASVLKGDAPNVGELCVIWIAGVVAYAIVTRIEPFFMEGWYEFRFLILRKLPPQEHEWRVKYEHLQGNEFQIDNHSACILTLNMGSIVSPMDDPNTIKAKSWQEMLDGEDKRKPEDDCPPGGCSGDNCPNSG